MTVALQGLYLHSRQHSKTNTKLIHQHNGTDSLFLSRSNAGPLLFCRFARLSRTTIKIGRSILMHSQNRPNLLQLIGYCADRNLIPKLPDIAYSCIQHGPVTAWFGPARPGNVIPVPKTYTLLGRKKYVVYRNGIASVKVKFCVLLEFPFVKNRTASKKMQSSVGYETMFLKRRDNVWSCVRCFPH